MTKPEPLGREQGQHWACLQEIFKGKSLPACKELRTRAPSTGCFSRVRLFRSLRCITCAVSASETIARWLTRGLWQGFPVFLVEMRFSSHSWGTKPLPSLAASPLPLCLPFHLNVSGVEGVSKPGLGSKHGIPTPGTILESNQDCGANFFFLFSINNQVQQLSSQGIVGKSASAKVLRQRKAGRLLLCANSTHPKTSPVPVSHDWFRRVMAGVE